MGILDSIYHKVIAAPEDRKTTLISDPVGFTVALAAFFAKGLVKQISLKDYLDQPPISPIPSRRFSEIDPIYQYELEIQMLAMPQFLTEKSLGLGEYLLAAQDKLYLLSVRTDGRSVFSFPIETSNVKALDIFKLGISPNLPENIARIFKVEPTDNRRPCLAGLCSGASILMAIMHIKNPRNPVEGFLKNSHLIASIHKTRNQQRDNANSAAFTPPDFLVHFGVSETQRSWQIDSGNPDGTIDEILSEIPPDGGVLHFKEALHSLFIKKNGEDFTVLDSNNVIQDARCDLLPKKSKQETADTIGFCCRLDQAQSQTVSFVTYQN